MEAMSLFLNSLRSNETKRSYAIYLKKYMEFLGIIDLLSETNPRLIEQQMIEYIIKMKEMGKGYSTLHNYIATVVSFYRINDIVLNTKKISKFMPEQTRLRKDKAYTHEQISKLLEIADERMRVVILLLASSGIRIGSTSSLKLGNLEDNKLTVYENTREEYFTFITPECKKAIDNYIDIQFWKCNPEMSNQL
jgi:integrase